MPNEKTKRKVLIEKTQVDDERPSKSLTQPATPPNTPEKKSSCSSSKAEKNTDSATNSQSFVNITASSSATFEKQASIKAEEREVNTNSISLVPVFVQRRTGGSNEMIPKSAYALDIKKDLKRRKF